MRASRVVILAAAIGWMVFYFASFAALGSSAPTVESSGQEIVEYFSDDATNARVYAWTAPFAFLALVVFGGQIAALLRKPSSYIFFGGVIAWAITGMVQAWFWAGLALTADGLDPATARTLFAIPQYWGPIINGSTMTMSAAFIALGFGAARMIPAWLAWLSVALFVEQAIETITVFGQSGFLAPGGTMNLYVGGTIGLAWVIGVLVWGYQRLGSSALSAAEPTG